MESPYTFQENWKPAVIKTNCTAPFVAENRYLSRFVEVFSDNRRRTFIHNQRIKNETIRIIEKRSAKLSIAGNLPSVFNSISIACISLIIVTHESQFSDVFHGIIYKKSVK